MPIQAFFHRVIDEYLKEEEMVWIVVGDGDTQREALSGFGYGDPVELDRRGRLIGHENGVK